MDYGYNDSSFFDDCFFPPTSPLIPTEPEFAPQFPPQTRMSGNIPVCAQHATDRATSCWRCATCGPYMGFHAADLYSHRPVTVPGSFVATNIECQYPPILDNDILSRNLDEDGSSQSDSESSSRHSSFEEQQQPRDQLTFLPETETLSNSHEPLSNNTHDPPSNIHDPPRAQGIEPFQRFIRYLPEESTNDEEFAASYLNQTPTQGVACCPGRECITRCLDNEKDRDYEKTATGSNQNDFIADESYLATLLEANTAETTPKPQRGRGRKRKTQDVSPVQEEEEENGESDSDYNPTGKKKKLVKGTAAAKFDTAKPAYGSGSNGGMKRTWAQKGPKNIEAVASSRTIAGNAPLDDISVQLGDASFTDYAPEATRARFAYVAANARYALEAEETCPREDYYYGVMEEVRGSYIHLAAEFNDRKKAYTGSPGRTVNQAVLAHRAHQAIYAARARKAEFILKKLP